MFCIRKYVWFTNTTVSSIAAGRTINAWQDTFIQVTGPSLPDWAELPYDKYLHIYVVYCLFCPCMICAALRLCARKTSKKSWFHWCSIQHIWIYDSIFSNYLQPYLYCTRIVFWMDLSFAWYQVLGLKSYSKYLKFRYIDNLLIKVIMNYAKIYL